MRSSATLKNKTRTVCFVAGSGEHQIEDSERNGYSNFKELLGKDNYQAKSIDLLAESRSAERLHSLGSRRTDPRLSAARSRRASRSTSKTAGRALFMLDPPLKIGRSDIADNDALTGLLQSWGVTMDKDLILDLNPIGQLAGLGPQVALVTTYDSHPIVNGMKGTATGFPLSRSLEIKNGDKTTVQKLFDSSGTQSGDHQSEFSGGGSERSQEQKGTADHCRRRHLQHRQTGFAGTVCRGRQFVVGGELVPQIQRQQRSGVEYDRLAVVRRGPDLDSSQERKTIVASP